MIDKKNSFKVPAGYFENLSEQIISRLPEKEIVETPVLSLWEKMKPWVYMAAMFVGIALMVKMFVTPASGTNILAQGSEVSVSDIDTFYSFYENQYIEAEYHQTMYYFDDDEITE